MRLGKGRLALEPDRHTRFEACRITFRVEAYAQRAAVMIADRTFGLPGRKRAKRRELGDCGGVRFSSRQCDLNLVAHREPMEHVLACIE